MTLKRSLLLMITLATNPLVAYAEDKPVSVAEPTPTSALCMPLPDFQKFAIDEAGFVVNNFSVREVKDILSDMMQLETTYSIANRSSQAVRFSGDFVYLDAENRILAAVNASPDELRIDPSVTTVGKGKTFVNAGDSAAIKTVCVRIFGTAPDKRD